METLFCWSVVSNIYVYKWECNYNVILSVFPSLPLRAIYLAATSTVRNACNPLTLNLSE